MNIKYILFAILDCLCFALGREGMVLSIIPTVPFFLATLVFFANSSKKLQDWFEGMKMYKKHLESYVQKEEC